MRRVVFVLGAPGVGKTTLVRHLLGDHTMVGRWSCGARFCALGPYTGNVRDGGDSLPHARAVVERSLERLETEVPGDLVALLDGTRFGREDAAFLCGRATRIGLVLVAKPATLVARRAQRGSPPMPAPWYGGHERRAVDLASTLDRWARVSTDLHPEGVLRHVGQVIG